MTVRKSVFIILFMAFSLVYSCGTTGGSSDGKDKASIPPPTNNWNKSSTPVLSPGSNGMWDDETVEGPDVHFDGSIYHMWYTGYDGSNYAIGYANSPDGVSWTKSPFNPVLDVGSPDSWDDFRVYSPTVIHDGTTYRMWYSGHDGNNPRTGYATSPDGIVWTKHDSNPVLINGTAGEWDEIGAFSPTVVFDDGIYHMWFMGQDAATPYRFGYASSDDGIIWTKHVSNPVMSPGTDGAWDDYRIVAPSVIYDGKYRMWYSGSDGSNFRIGYAVSDDGLTWTKDVGNPVLNISNIPSWDDTDVVTSSVLYNGTGYEMWFAGGDGDNRWIGHATSE